jgi:hypothetical protein
MEKINSLLILSSYLISNNYIGMRMILKSMKCFAIIGAFFLTAFVLHGNDDACYTHVTPEQLQQAIDKTLK